MEIEIKNTELKDVWDIQKAKLVLEMSGVSSEGLTGLTNEIRENFKKEITLYLWKKMQEQFPKIKEFCTGKTGGFNKSEKRHFNTPIINIHGDFYLQLISLNNHNNWIWESVSLEPFRFEFNESGYLKSLLIDAMNKAIISGGARKETFEKLILALNETETEEIFLTIQKSEKDAGKVELHKTKTKIN